MYNICFIPCRWAGGLTLRDVRNDNKEIPKLENITGRCRKARMIWFGQVKRQEQEYIEGRTLEMVPTWRRKRGRPKQRWMGCFNQDLRATGATQVEGHDRTGWRRILSAAETPQLSGSG